MRRRRGLALGVGLAIVAAAPASAAEVQVKGLDTLLWEPATVQVQTGDTVRWTFAGTEQFHNVKSNSANWDLTSPLGKPAPDATFTFSAPGTYSFLCQVHPDTMVGTVSVADATSPPPPPPPPPPLSEQPFPNDAPSPAEVETGGLDETRPTLRALSLRQGRRGGATVSLRASERARVSVRVKRGRRVLASRNARAATRHRIALPRLRAGAYQVEVRAWDIAGNAARARVLRVRIR